MLQVGERECVFVSRHLVFICLIRLVSLCGYQTPMDTQPAAWRGPLQHPQCPHSAVLQAYSCATTTNKQAAPLHVLTQHTSRRVMCVCIVYTLQVLWCIPGRAGCAPQQQQQSG